jgi:two-component system KDP operon response regulator KdpE
VLDLGLPDLDGLTVLKRLREWSRIPVLILTVRDADDEKVAALDSGADDYVTKPFSTAELLARLRVALATHNPGRRTPFSAAGTWKWICRAAESPCTGRKSS